MVERFGLTWIDVGNVAWIATASAALGVLGARVFGRRSPSLAHAIVTAAAMIVLISPVLGLGGRLWGLVELASSPAPVRDSAVAGLPSPALPLPPLAKPALLGSEPPHNKVVSADSPMVFSWLDAIVAAWVLGTILAVGRQVHVGVLAWRLRHCGALAHDEVLKAAERLAHMLGLPAPEVVESDAATIPLALGPLWPVIVLPCGFAQRVSAEELDAALRHELGHFARRHHLTALLQAACNALFWWNPAVRYLGRVQDSLQEEIADNFVLAGGTKRDAYAAFLVRLAELHSSRTPRVGLAIFAHNSALSRRIESLLRKERPLMTRVSAAGRTLIVMATAASAVLLAFSSIRMSEASPTKTPGAQQGGRQVEGRKGQTAGQFKVETFRKGRAIPVGKAEVRRPGDQPPTIIYPGSRTSSDWVETKAGTRVAVAEGVEWQGKIAYLSLTFDVVVVDAKTKKCQWSTSVGGFWDTITFEDVAKDGEKPKWVLALRSTSKPEYQQNYDLETGEKLELRGGPATPEGKAVTPRKVWSGSAGVRDKNLYQLIGKADEWTKLRTELFGAEPKDIPTAADVDWSKETLLVCFGGAATNWRGIGVELAVENDERVLLRLHRSTYQSIGGMGHEHPYGLIVLPRRADKPHVLEYNRQGLIGGPAIWREFARVSVED